MADAMIKIITEQLKCRVCHETLYCPKDLPCRHSVCNDCLDGLVSFQEDGTGTLQCPHGCEGVIKIGVNDSVSSMLSLNYVTQNLLCSIKEKQNIDLSLCQDDGLNCDEMACKSCSVCSKKTCTSCWKAHNCENKTSTSVIFDERKQSFEAYCKQHGVYARIICMDCENKLICMYCSNRAHQTHMKDTVENHAIILKNTLSLEFENAKKNFPNSGISYKDELKNMAEKRMDLVNELEERIVKKLNHNTKSLIEQKDILLQQFDAKVGEYKRNLTEFGLEELNYEEAFLSYIGILNTKPFFEILSEKDEIMQKSATLGSVRFFIASLTDCDDGKDNTIGDLYVTTCKKNEMHEDDNVVDVIYEKSYQTDEDCTKDLVDLTKNITELKNLVQDTKQMIRKVKTIKYSFANVVQLLKDGNLNELRLLLRHQPDVIHLKSSNKETLIFKASKLGKHESLKLLLDSNIDHINTCATNHSPLTIATFSGHISCVELLLQHNCDVNMMVYGGWTALMYASNQGTVDCVKILLANNADINIRDILRRTAKDCAKTNEIKQILTTYANNK